MDAETDERPTEALPHPRPGGVHGPSSGAARLEDLALIFLRQLLHRRGIDHVSKATPDCGHIQSAIQS